MALFTKEKPITSLENDASNEPQKDIAVTTFSTDVLFLMFSIKQNLKMGINTIIETELNKEFIRETALKDLSSTVAYEVITSMSPLYKKLMLNYWNEEGLTNFIVSTITFELTNLSINLNNTRLSGNNTLKNTVVARQNTILSEFNL